MQNGIKTTRKIAAAMGIDPTREILPGPKFQSDEELAESVPHLLYIYYILQICFEFDLFVVVVVVVQNPVLTYTV